VGIDTRNDAAQNERGSAKRENRFQNEMSVRVVALGENGMLQLKGTKNINVDKNLQDITLSGWVRAQDISSANMVESARIANATIGYTSPGNLTKPKQGMLSKILGAFWP
ncbi:MAG: flagellar basal body L-ring protein FlgH, partial [Gemmatimonadaceae bacterium]